MVWPRYWPPKERAARPEYEAGQAFHTVSFEAFGKEFASAARLTQGAAAKANAPQCLRGMRGLGVKAPAVAGARPEAHRSRPGQDEAWRKLGGGPDTSWDSNHRDDLGLGVKKSGSLAEATRAA